jgi:hypothetical protein
LSCGNPEVDNTLGFPESRDEMGQVRTRTIALRYKCVCVLGWGLGRGWGLGLDFPHLVLFPELM